MIGSWLLLSQERIDAVRVNAPEDIRRAAEALHEIALSCGFRAAPAHDIADKRTPVDVAGNVLARDTSAVIAPDLGGTNVLGMNFLSRLASWRVEGRILVLTPKH